jgi:hypothetical protein
MKVLLCFSDMSKFFFSLSLSNGDVHVPFCQRIGRHRSVRDPLHLALSLTKRLAQSRQVSSQSHFCGEFGGNNFVLQPSIVVGFFNFTTSLLLRQLLRGSIYLSSLRSRSPPQYNRHRPEPSVEIQATCCDASSKVVDFTLASRSLQLSAYVHSPPSPALS